MKRYHDPRDERIRVRRQTWVRENWYSDQTSYAAFSRAWDDAAALEHPLGKYRKNRPSGYKDAWQKAWEDTQRHRQDALDLHLQFEENQTRYPRKNRKNGKAARCQHTDWEEILRGWPSTHRANHHLYHCLGCGKQIWDRPRGRIKACPVTITKSQKMIEWEQEQAEKKRRELEQRPIVLKAWNNLW